MSYETMYSSQFFLGPGALYVHFIYVCIVTRKYTEYGVTTGAKKVKCESESCTIIPTSQIKTAEKITFVLWDPFK